MAFLTLEISARRLPLMLIGRSPRLLRDIGIETDEIERSRPVPSPPEPRDGEAPDAAHRLLAAAILRS